MKTKIYFLKLLIFFILIILPSFSLLGAPKTLKMGALATLEGPFTILGQDGMRGVELALKEFNYKAGGWKIELIKGSSNANPDIAVAAARKLVEQDKVLFLVGPLSGSEGIAIKDYAKGQLQTTFVNGASAAQETTLNSPAPNFFRFSTDGAQWQVGLGGYSYKKGYKKVVIVAEDYSFPYSMVQGFMVEYCGAGGRVLGKNWVPLGTKDYSSVIAKIPVDIDAIYVALGGADAVNFLKQYEQSGGDRPIIGGAITVDQSVLSYKGKNRNSLLGTNTAGPIADNNPSPEWKKFVADYKAAFKDGFPSPSIFAHSYYVNTKALLVALNNVKGNLSNNHKALRKELSTMVLDTPTGKVRLDANRNAIADIYLTEVAKDSDGVFFNKLISTTKNVNQYLGLSASKFKQMGVGTRNNPECK